MDLPNILSICCNVFLAVAAVAAVWAHARHSPLRVVLRFFTVLSNLLCALSALAVALFRLGGALPDAVRLLKYAGTAGVTITLLTVLVFLGPTIGYRVLLTGPDFWLHLACPLLALLSYFAWDRPNLPFWTVLIGVLPMLLYAPLYLCKVLLAPEERRWKDFYGFNRGGRWRLSLLVMLAADFLISAALWII